MLVIVLCGRVHVMYLLSDMMNHLWNYCLHFFCFHYKLFVLVLMWCCRCVWTFTIWAWRIEYLFIEVINCYSAFNSFPLHVWFCVGIKAFWSNSAVHVKLLPSMMVCSVSTGHLSKYPAFCQWLFTAIGKANDMVYCK